MSSTLRCVCLAFSDSKSMRAVGPARQKWSTAGRSTCSIQSESPSRLWWPRVDLSPAGFSWLSKPDWLDLSSFSSLPSEDKSEVSFSSVVPSTTSTAPSAPSASGPVRSRGARSFSSLATAASSFDSSTAATFKSSSSSSNCPSVSPSPSTTPCPPLTTAAVRSSSLATFRTPPLNFSKSSTNALSAKPTRRTVPTLDPPTPLWGASMTCDAAAATWSKRSCASISRPVAMRHAPRSMLMERSSSLTCNRS
mmetsp:Transcript_6065/g.27175  ORF Transcript_6065/g.27175 Transcript_6065/m.27175 type:complete len:251 (-) Transcript_6065:576-1328(-)